MFKLIFRCLLIFASVMVLINCQLTNGDSDRLIDDSVLIKPSDFARAFSQTQQIELSFQEKSVVFDAVVESSLETIQVAIVHLGRLMLQVSYDGSQVREFKEVNIPNVISGRRVLFDVQLVYGDLLRLNQKLPVSWQVVQNNSTQRTVLKDDKKLFKIDYLQYDNTSGLPKEVVLTNLAYGYKMHIISSSIHE